MKKLVATTAAAALAAGLSAGVANDYRVPDDIAIPPAPGVSAETLLQVDQVGRTNVHSGGRTGGHANKRHGGQGRNHPAGESQIENYCWESGASTGCTQPTSSDGTVVEIQLTAGVSYSPPTKHRFGRGKPSKPKKPLGRR